MQSPFCHPIAPSALFSRERRKQRINEFLSGFERAAQSWAEQDFLGLPPFPKPGPRSDQPEGEEQTASAGR